MFDFIKKLTYGKRGPTNAGMAWRSNALLQDCLRALRGSATVAIPDQREAVEAVVQFARMEESWMPAGAVPEDYLTEMVFVLWDDPSLPVLYCRSGIILENIHDVTAAANETWLVSESLDRIAHFDENLRVRLYPDHA